VISQITSKKKEKESAPEEEMETEVTKAVCSWRVKELDEFFSTIDIPNPYCAPTEEKAHWFSRSSYSDTKAHGREEKTPMYYMQGSYISVQRIICILFKNEDPIYKSKIYNRCDVSYCVNPSHLTLNKELT
jgi:hypothetical protein